MMHFRNLFLITITAMLMQPVIATRPALADSEEDEQACSMEGSNVSPCTPGKLNPALKEALAKKEIPQLEVYYAGGAPYESWSTSLLKPDGKDPLKGKDPKKVGACESNAHATWTCMYAAHRAQDDNPKTAWAEGKPDEGVGEVLVTKVNTSKPVEIWAGLGASAALHKQNARPKRVKVYALQSKVAEFSQYGGTYKNIAVLGEHEVELKDVNGYQPLALPAHKLAPVEDKQDGTPPNESFMAIEILSVYPGSKYKDTCISEIRNQPGK